MILFCGMTMMVYSSIAVTGGWDKVLLLDFGEKCPRFVFYIGMEGIL
jgi:hypothetical protein